MDNKQINIVFLGTGPSERIPRKGCDRPACRDARKKGSKSKRSQSSLFAQSKGSNLLFDVSEDILKQWKLASARKIDAIFLTHAHRDASGGLPKLKEILKSIGQDRVILYAEKDTIRQIRMRYKNLSFLDLKEASRYKKIRLGNLLIEGLRVEHSYVKLFPTLGYLVKYKNKKFAYLSDVKKIPERSLSKLKRLDILIIDSAMYKKQIPWHMNFKEALAVIKKVKPKKTYLTQIGIDWPPYRESAEIVGGYNNLAMSYDGLAIYL